MSNELQNQEQITELTYLAIRSSVITALTGRLKNHEGEEDTGFVACGASFDSAFTDGGFCSQHGSLYCPVFCRFLYRWSLGGIVRSFEGFFFCRGMSG
ncbi:MAG: hypothetical protein IKN20_00510, partial [Firmicutes bacterium]|nr:hypothetical protein [Bacillota bacterium]